MFILLLITSCLNCAAQYPVIKGCPAEVDFSDHVREWDGFGFNYVETAQTIDYTLNPNDYGGFSILTPEKRNEIIKLIFGSDGLKPGLIKMFLDPFHQESQGGRYDHKTTTANMRMFVRMGLAETRQNGGDLQIITTLYGPPAYMTMQKVLRGRDLDTLHKTDLALYLIDWARFLKTEENLPVKYISLHNEGEDWFRWPLDGKEGNIGKGHDYNMYWPPSQVAEYLEIMQPMLNKAGLGEIKVTNGEPTNWYRFSFWGLPEELVKNNKALNNLGLITSHGFYVGGYENRWYGSHTNKGISYLRNYRPELHAWVTSTSWSKMDSRFIKEIWGNIYEAEVNGIIPWAGIQRPPLWIGGDPNPGCAFIVTEEGNYEIQPGYYYYKQVSRAGQPGMKVARTMSMDSEMPLLAFAGEGTKNPNAFVVVNTSMTYDKSIDLSVTGYKSGVFEAYRTNGKDEKYKSIGDFKLEGNRLIYNAPPNSVTTFFEKQSENAFNTTSKRNLNIINAVKTDTISLVTNAMLAMQRRAWEQGVAAQALLELGEYSQMILLAKDAVVNQKPDGRLGLNSGDYPVADPAANGEPLLLAAQLTDDPGLKEAATRMAGYLLKDAQRTPEGIIYHNRNEYKIWVDAIYMAPPFLAAAGYHKEAMYQVEGYRKILMDKDKKLYYHIWDQKQMKYDRKLFWGVGNGWAAAGMTRVLGSLPESMAAEKKILSGYIREIIDGCLKYQRPDGLFNDILDDPSSFVETNSAQMFAYTIFRGVNEGWLNNTYLPYAEKMRKAAHKMVDKYGLVHGVCGAPDFNKPGTATEGQAFFLLMEAAYRDLKNNKGK